MPALLLPCAENLLSIITAQERNQKGMKSMQRVFTIRIKIIFFRNILLPQMSLKVVIRRHWTSPFYGNWISTVPAQFLAALLLYSAFLFRAVVKARIFHVQAILCMFPLLFVALSASFSQLAGKPALRDDFFSSTIYSQFFTACIQERLSLVPFTLRIVLVLYTRNNLCRLDTFAVCVFFRRPRSFRSHMLGYGLACSISV